MKLKFIAKKLNSAVSKLALSVVSVSALAATAADVNTTCIFWIHQPKLPEGAKKLRKF